MMNLNSKNWNAAGFFDSEIETEYLTDHSDPLTQTILKQQLDVSSKTVSSIRTDIGHSKNQMVEGALKLNLGFVIGLEMSLENIISLYEDYLDKTLFLAFDFESGFNNGEIPGLRTSAIKKFEKRLKTERSSLSSVMSIVWESNSIGRFINVSWLNQWMETSASFGKKLLKAQRNRAVAIKKDEFVVEQNAWSLYGEAISSMHHELGLADEDIPFIAFAILDFMKQTQQEFDLELKESYQTRMY